VYSNCTDVMSHKRTVYSNCTDVMSLPHNDVL
jgi:hypothetical protein